MEVGLLSIMGVFVARVPVKKLLFLIRRMAWFFTGYCELPCFVDAVVLCRPAVLAAHHCILRRSGAGAGILSALAQYLVYISGSCAHHFVAGLDERA
jgi:hypothetical protein